MRLQGGARGRVRGGPSWIRARKEEWAEGVGSGDEDDWA